MNFTELNDRGSEAISGGYWFTKIDYTKYGFNTTNLTQTNSVNNNGIGVLLGGGFAQSMQGNGFGLTAFIG